MMMMCAWFTENFPHRWGRAARPITRLSRINCTSSLFFISFFYLSVARETFVRNCKIGKKKGARFVPLMKRKETRFAVITISNIYMYTLGTFTGSWCDSRGWKISRQFHDEGLIISYLLLLAFIHAARRRGYTREMQIRLGQEDESVRLLRKDTPTLYARFEVVVFVSRCRSESSCIRHIIFISFHNVRKHLYLVNEWAANCCFIYIFVPISVSFYVKIKVTKTCFD